MALAPLLVAAALAGAPAPETLLKDKADLNGDGKADKILVVAAVGQGSLKAVKLTVGAVSVADIQMYKDVTVTIVDLDPGDAKKELFVDGTSESGKKWFTWFVWDGKRLVQALKVDTKSENGSVALKGAGEIIVDMPRSFYVQHDDYHLSGSAFEQVDVPFIYVGSPGTVKQPVLLMHDPNSSVQVASLDAGDLVEIVIASTGDKRWFLVRAPSGLVGWLKEDEIGKTITPGAPAVADE
jgi:hypothetical protein